MRYWLEIISIILAVIALFISIKAWHKSRAIYGIERTTLRQTRGRQDDPIVQERLQEINTKLTSGKYTILNIISREADGDFEIIFGKIKK